MVKPNVFDVTRNRVFIFHIRKISNNIFKLILYIYLLQKAKQKEAKRKEAKRKRIRNHYIGYMRNREIALFITISTFINMEKLIHYVIDI